MKKIVLIFLILITQSSCSQNFEVKNVPHSIEENIKNEKVSIPKDAVYIEDLLPNGENDYTQTIQNIIDTNKIIVFPNFPIKINDKGLYLQSNSKIYFQEKSKIILKSPKEPKKDLENIKDWYDIIRIYDKENIELYNANIQGDRFTHVDDIGEWGAGIGIRNSSNIKIINAKISDTWGEGIFVGSENGGVSKNIFLQNIKIDKARRNGLAITSAKNTYVENILISNTYGTAPQYAVDIEPSWYTEDLENVYINKIYTYNNVGGIAINTSALDNDTINTNKKVVIYIKNHYDEFSEIPFGTSFNPNDKKYIPSGFVYLENLVWKNNKSYNYFFSNNNRNNIKLYIDNIKVIKNNKDISDDIMAKYKGKLIRVKPKS